jgi:hypothetical protein
MSSHQNITQTTWRDLKKRILGIIKIPKKIEMVNLLKSPNLKDLITIDMSTITTM